MKTKKKLYNFGGPGDDEKNLVGRYNKTVPGLKEQQLKESLGTVYNTDDNTWLNNLYNGFEQLNTNREGNRNPIAELATYPFQAGTRLAASLDGQYSYGDVTDPMSYVNTGLDMLAVSPIGKPLNNAGKQTAKALGTESGVLSKAYKVNPWAFKPNENNWYRQVGKSAVNDAFNTNVVREAGEEVSPRMAKEFEEQLVRMQGHGKEAILSSRKPASPYFGKGELFYPMGRKPNLKSKNPAAKGSADYLIETSLPNESFQPAYVKGMGLGVPTEIGQTAILKPNPALRNIENFKFYEKNWLKGYKEISKPAVKTTASPIPSSQLPRDLEPYISKKIIPATKEEKVFNSFLSTQGQAKEIMKRTKKYDPNGKEILEYGGQLKKKFYAFGSNSANTVGAPTIKPEKNINTVPSSYTDDFSNKTRSKPSFDMGVPSTNFNQSGYIGAATAAATGIANTVNAANNAPDKQTKDNAITYGTVDTTMNVVGGIFPVVGAIEGAADAGKSVVDSTNPTTTVRGDDGKIYSFKDGKEGDHAAAWSASYNPVGNISNFIGDISGSTENYGRSDFGMALGDLFLPFVTEGLRNQDAKEAYSKSIIPNYTSGDSSMKAYAFGGPMPILPKGVNPINKFTDFKDSTFKTHKEKGVGITPNDEVEKNESMYRFGRTKKATGGSSDGGYVFSHILGEDEQGNVSVVPQGSKAPKGWKSYADMSREAMS